jgi:hypothetical protein
MVKKSQAALVVFGISVVVSWFSTIEIEVTWS